MDVEDYSHPYLPNFYFTGRVRQQSDGSLLYEYFDSMGYWGPQDDLYFSSLRPTDLDFPLGYYEPNEIERDICLSVNQYPVRGEVNRVGLSLGYKTNGLYSKLRTFYLYERPDGSSILLDSKETAPYSFDFIDQVKAVVGLLSPSIHLVSTDNTQSFTLR